MDMHSVANLATLQTRLFPFIKAPKPYLVSENRRYCRYGESWGADHSVKQDIILLL